MRGSSRLLIEAALVAAGLVAFVVIAFRPSDPGAEVEIRDPSPGIDEIRVDVRGAVQRPGVVTVKPGDRIADAIAIAGGPNADADLGGLNLSRRLVDEDQVTVPRTGERKAPLLDLNTAAARDMEALPGIGSVTAAAIVDSRERIGRFASTDELLTRGLVSAKVYAQVRDLIAVH